jgi:tRNA (adenine58-N1)-methyltransferase non-catalytic subunit
MMNMTGGGGYILHAIHVYDDPKASSVLAGMRQRRKERRMQNSGSNPSKRTATNGDKAMATASDDVDMSSVDSDK